MRRMRGLVPFMVWAALLPCLTAARVPVWQSSETLWRDAMRTSPEKLRPVLNVAAALDRAGNTGGAAIYYTRAMEMARNPARPERERETALVIARTNMASVAMRTGDYARARVLIDAVLDGHPAFAPALSLSEMLTRVTP